MLYRKEIDKQILEELKNKIEEYLKSKDLKTAEFIRKNMDEVGKLVVENSIEQGGPKMQSRPAREKVPSEIMIDKSFAIIDQNDNPIGIDDKVKKLILTQLSHELLHSGSRFNGQSGIISKDNRRNTGLNEGMTQMFTEKIWGYTLSPNTDSKYKDYKKIAKILDATFGEDVSLDAYFNHTISLEEACNQLSQNNRFYSDLNRYLTSTFYMNSSVKKENRDKYFGNIMKPVRDKMIDLLYEKLCMEIIVPKLKTLSKQEQQKYLYDILNSVKDESTVFKKLSDSIKKYANLNEKELQEQIKIVDKNLRQTEEKKEFIVDIYNERDCDELVIVSDDGKTIKSSDNPSLVIEDENLKEKILSQLYFQEKGIAKEDFGRKTKAICDNIGEADRLDFNERTTLEKKKIFSAMKVSVRDNGYAILNSSDECEKDEKLPLKTLPVNEGEAVNFNELRDVYRKVTVDFKDDSWTELIAIDRETGKQITDLQLSKMAKFAEIWVTAAGTKWYADEELHGITYAFNESSERIYNQLGELVSKSMQVDGSIDTQAIYDELSKDKYKYSEEIIRNLLSNRGNMKIVYDFYKMQNKGAKLETELAKTSNEFVLGVSRENMVINEVESIMQAIPETNLDTKDGHIQALRPEDGMAQSENERIKKDEEARTRTEQELVKYKNETLETTDISQEIDKKSISINDIKRNILTSKITESEKEQKEADIAKNQRKRLLFKRSREGVELSQEERLMLEEMERQRMQAEDTYKIKRENAKNQWQQH